MSEASTKNKYPSWSKEARKEYATKYYAKHREQAKERAKKWNAVNKEQIRAKGQSYYLKNKDAIKEKVKAWRAANPERCRVSKKAYYWNNHEKECSARRESAAERRINGKANASQRSWRSKNGGHVKFITRRHHNRMSAELRDGYVRTLLRRTYKILNPTPEQIEERRRIILQKRAQKSLSMINHAKNISNAIAGAV